MISLRSSSPAAPLEPGADLIGHLAASPRPAIIHYTGQGRTELSGRVATNWATKTTHLIDSYGIASPDTMLIDVPVTWRSLALVLGIAWCDVACSNDPDDAGAILTDRFENYDSAHGEIFVTHREDVDPALIDLDDEVLSHADQPLLPVPDIIGTALRADALPTEADTRSGGVVIRSSNARLTPELWWVIVDAWRRSTPVVLVDDEVAEQLERIVETERLGTVVQR